MDHFHGPVWASHNNVRALVPHTRQFTAEQIKCLIQRNAVIGGALDAWMMVPGWIRGRTTPESARVTLATLVEHLDHICQLAGNARHVGIGTDLDGGYGTEQTPIDLDSIADIAKLGDILAARGYQQSDIDGIFYTNYVNFIRNAWR